MEEGTYLCVNTGCGPKGYRERIFGGCCAGNGRGLNAEELRRKRGKNNVCGDETDQ